MRLLSELVDVRGRLGAVAVISIITSLSLETHHGRLDVILVMSLAAVVGPALATVLILEYPVLGLAGNLTPDQI